MTSIQSKLIQLQIGVAGAVLLVASGAFYVNDTMRIRAGVVRTLTSTARILADNLAPALSFVDREVATKILASLHAEPNVSGACLFDKDGRLFATYGKSPSVECGWVEFEGQSLVVEAPGQVGLYLRVLEGSDGESEPIGTVFIKWGTELLSKELVRYGLIVIFVFCAGLAISLALAAFMQRFLSRPIVSLLNVVRSISGSGDYSVRVGSLPFRGIPREIVELSREFDRMIEQVEERDRRIQQANAELEQKVEERTVELKALQNKALQNAHAAGMAEIATGVLHNIGNIVNTVNISAAEIQRTLQASGLRGLLRVNELIQKNLERLPEFLSADPAGQAIPQYLLKTGELLREEQARLGEEAALLLKKMALIRDVIGSQQAYARSGEYDEELDVAEVINDVLHMMEQSLRRHGISVRKTLRERALIVRGRKIKVAHIFFNLIKNAQEAMERNSDGNKVLSIETKEAPGDGVSVWISDNGEGIPSDRLSKIFNHGFTTKEQGHGFGLHFCALAMKEMGGRLEVRSEGLGKGSSFMIFFGSKEEGLDGHMPP